MTAAQPLVEPTGPTFLVPPSDTPLAEQASLYCDQRDHLVAWIAEQIESATALAELNQLIRSADVARRAALARRLGRGAVLAAQEVARRAERALHISVEAARQRGDLIRRGHNRNAHGSFDEQATAGKQLGDYGIQPTTMASSARVYVQNDHVFSNAEFDAAISRCITMGTLSRDHLEGALADIVATREGSDRVTRMKALAAEGYTSAQMAAELGIGVDHTRRQLKANGIVVPGDQVTMKRRKTVSPEQIIGRVVELVEGAASSLEMLDPADYQVLDDEDRANYARSMAASLRTLRSMHKELTTSVN
jgi:hypothetical protein